jgi:hypothetical protein
MVIDLFLWPNFQPLYYKILLLHWGERGRAVIGQIALLSLGMQFFTHKTFKNHMGTRLTFMHFLTHAAVKVSKKVHRNK